MKFALIFNNTNWQSVQQKIKNVESFFASVDNLQMDLFNSNFTQFEWSTVETVGGITNTLGPKETLTLKWLENNVKKTGYDCTVFYLDNMNCVGHNYPAGINYEINPGIIVLYGAAGLEENDTSSVEGIQLGNSFELFLEHELSHQYEFILKHVDNTHKYFYAGTPKLILEDLSNLKNMEIYQQFTEYSKIYAWAKAIAPEEGARSDLNNPGDLKVTNLTKSWGATNGFQASDSGWIAKFTDYNTGFKALCNLLTMIADNTIVGYHLDRSFEGVMKIYANNPLQSYIQDIAKQLGISTSIDVSTFLT